MAPVSQFTNVGQAVTQSEGPRANTFIWRSPPELQVSLRSAALDTIARVSVRGYSSFILTAFTSGGALAAPINSHIYNLRLACSFELNSVEQPAISAAFSTLVGGSWLFYGCGDYMVIRLGGYTGSTGNTDVVPASLSLVATA